MNSLPDSPGSIYVPNNQGVVAQTVEQLNVFSGETTDQLVTRYYRKLAKECEVATTQAHHPLETKGVASASKVGAVYVEPDVWELFELKKPTAKDVEVDTTEIEVEVGENRKITSAKRRRPWRECFESTVEEFKRLMLLADGGMGKTTVVDVQVQRLNEEGKRPWLALRLPQVWQVGHQADPSDLVDIALAYDLASKLNESTTKAEAVARVLLDKLDAAPGVLLFDALDEVPNSHRQRVMAGIFQFLERCWMMQPNHKVLITSRPYAVADDWLGNELTRRGFVQIELARFTTDQRNELVENYFDSPGRDPQWGNALVRQLNEADKPEHPQKAMSELLLEPMLATYACMYAEERLSKPGKAIAIDWPLPATRYELFDGVVRLLLERWDVKRRDSVQTAGLEPLFTPEAGNLGGRSPLRHVLEQATLQEHLHRAQIEQARSADKAHRSGSDPVELKNSMVSILHQAFFDGDAHEPLSAASLIAAIDGCMPWDMPVRAHKVYEWLVTRSGLVTLEQGTLAKTKPRLHRQLLEFLAAGRLWDSDKGGADFALELIVRCQDSPDYSRQLIAMGFERLVVEAKGRCSNVLGALLTSLQEWESWCEKVSEDLSALGTSVLAQALAQALPTSWLSSDKTLASALNPLRQRLVEILVTQRLTSLERCNMADALGTLGDPRFQPGLWFLKERFAGNTSYEEPLPGFVRIPCGEFLMGHQSFKDNPVRQEVINQPFLISRSLTTVAQFARFVDAKGYQQGPELWGEEVWKILQGEERAAPRNWAQQLAYPHRPVVEVSWWEVLAYLRWLNRDAEFLSWKMQTPEVMDWKAILPTEPQWERAIRMLIDGSAHHDEWPWSNSFEGVDQRANLDEARIGHVSVVGCFSPHALGLWDFIGNAWEFVDGDHEILGFDPISTQVSNSLSTPMIRGGSWSCLAGDMRASSGFRYRPDEWSYGSVGFRVALSLGEIEI